MEIYFYDTMINPRIKVTRTSFQVFDCATFGRKWPKNQLKIVTKFLYY